MVNAINKNDTVVVFWGKQNIDAVGLLQVALNPLRNKHRFITFGKHFCQAFTVHV